MSRKIFFNLITLLLMLVSSNIFAQTGKIIGNIKDNKTGDPLPFANVLLVNTNSGAASDLDGDFIKDTIKDFKMSQDKYPYSFKLLEEWATKSKKKEPKLNKSSKNV